MTEGAFDQRLDISESGSIVTMPMRIGDNSLSARALLEASIKSKLKSTTGSSFATLQVNMELGCDLIKLKPHFLHGDFGGYVKNEFKMSRQWSSRLMKLGFAWPEVLQAIEWAKKADEMDRSEWSVDGALKLFAKWNRHIKSGGPDAATSSSPGEATSRPQDGSAETLNPLDLLMALWAAALAQARAHIRSLEAEIEWLHKHIDDQPAKPERYETFIDVPQDLESHQSDMADA